MTTRRLAIKKIGQARGSLSNAFLITQNDFKEYEERFPEVKANLEAFGQGVALLDDMLESFLTFINT